MNEQNSIIVANSPRIPCTIRTLKPFWIAAEGPPWVHQGELSDALLYLAARAGLPDAEIRALKELLESLSSSLKSLSASPDPHPGDTDEP